MHCEEREKKTLEARIEKFIQKGEAKYGENTYDYSQVWGEYKNNRTPVHIKCNRCNNKPFPVYPFAHTSQGDNQKGTCPACYVPKETVQETRWDPNLPQRIREFKERIKEKYGKGYSYPNLDQEYKNEESHITVICHNCKSEPYQRKARSLKSKSRKGGCKTCNKKTMAEIIAKKNRERLLRNHQTKDIPREYGCIYKIINKKNYKFYIGYTTMSAKKRFKAHLDEAVKASRGNKKAKSYLHSAMNYHGHESFSVEIIKEFKNVAPTKLGDIEMRYIAKMGPQYNISPGGELGHYKTNINRGGNVK